MTREEALEKMKQGFKITNEYFTSEEYLHMVDGVIRSEDGYNFDEWFYFPRLSETWKYDGWRLF